jgi:putative copper export protein
MCVLAIVNRYVFMPRIPHGGPGARQLGHGTVAEIVPGGAILLLVSMIGMMSPH